jgi:hypothetical protein
VSASTAQSWRPTGWTGAIRSTPTAEPYDVDDSIVAALRRVPDRLGLRMGIFDMKLDPHDQPWWLEVDPQVQFLFVEGMCGLPLTEAFTALLDELRSARSPRAASSARLQSAST